MVLADRKNGTLLPLATKQHGGSSVKASSTRTVRSTVATTAPDQSASGLPSGAATKAICGLPGTSPGADIPASPDLCTESRKAQNAISDLSNDSRSSPKV